MKKNDKGRTDMSVFLTDLKGRVRNFNLPKKKPLLPLLEAVVNSIYAIEDAKFLGIEPQKGTVSIHILRDDQERLPIDGITDDVNDIVGFVVLDNGIGFTEANMQSFMQSDSTYRLEKGGKGIGRFSWLKTFQAAKIDSRYIEDGEWRQRKFVFSLDESDINDMAYPIKEQEENCTRIELSSYKPEYQKYVPKEGKKIATIVMHHCFLYLMSSICPRIEVIDGERVYCVNEMFESLLKRDENDIEFEVMGENFHLLHCFISDPMLEGNRLYYFANERKVQEIDLDKRIVNLSKKIYKEKNYYYIGVVSGQYLDENVNENRDSFAIPYEADKEELSIKEITDAAVSIIEDRLKGYLSVMQDKKEKHIKKYVKENAPQYTHLLRYMSGEIAAIPPGLTDRRLDDELYKIKREFDNQVKEENEKILKVLQVGAVNYNDYQEKLQKQFSKISDANKASLSEYVAHRKVVLDLLKLGLRSKDLEKYNKEEYFHDLIYPMRQTSEDIEYQSHNLWLIDERLAYADYIASDIPFDNDPKNDRPDILVLDHPVAVSDEPNTGREYETITIFELKRPMRDDYTIANNPIIQMINYVSELKTNKMKDKNGRFIRTGENTQFYLYAVW